MRLNICKLFLASICLMVSQTQAQNAVIESFDYESGLNFNGLGESSNGWASSWALFPTQAENPSDYSRENTVFINDTVFQYEMLAYPVSNIGNHVSGLNNGAASWGYQRYGRYLSETWPDEAGKVYWISFLLEMGGTWNSNSWAGISLYDSLAEGPLFGKGWGKTDISIGSAKTDTGNTSYSWDSGPAWITCRIAMSGDDSNENMHMWVNWDPTSIEPDTSFADTYQRWISINNGFNRIAYHFGGELPTEVLAVDEIRIGTSWADVSAAATVIDGNNIITPDRLFLSQNYPNPFNPGTQINFTINKSGYIKLAVYDISGKEITIIKDGYFVQGDYTVHFNAAELSSGMYFYKLFAADGSITKKLTIIK